MTTYRSSTRWGTITTLDPLTVTLAGDTTPIQIGLEAIATSDLATGQRVWLGELTGGQYFLGGTLTARGDTADPNPPTTPPPGLPTISIVGPPNPFNMNGIGVAEADLTINPTTTTIEIGNPNAALLAITVHTFPPELYDDFGTHFLRCDDQDGLIPTGTSIPRPLTFTATGYETRTIDWTVIR